MVPATGKATGRSRQLTRLLLATFCATVVIFAFLLVFIFAQNLIYDSNRYFEAIFFPGISLLFILGIVLIIMSGRSCLKRGIKVAFILTGVSAVGMPACAVLHNLFYAVFILLFGDDFWSLHGADEAMFFILALIVFPVLLVISSIWGTVLIARSRGDLTV